MTFCDSSSLFYSVYMVCCCRHCVSLYRVPSIQHWRLELSMFWQLFLLMSHLNSSSPSMVCVCLFYVLMNTVELNNTCSACPKNGRKRFIRKSCQTGMCNWCCGSIFIYLLKTDLIIGEAMPGV